MRFAIVVLLIVSLIPGASAQELDPDSNWIREIGKGDDFYSRFEFKRYAAKDVIAAKLRFFQIEKKGFHNEWEGVYHYPTESGETSLIWNSDGGFVYTHIYHWLSSLDHGRVRVDGDSVQFLTEATDPSKASFQSSEIYYKVRIGPKHYLVERKSMKEFGERVGGRETSADFMRNYFYRKDELDIPTKGLAVFPKAYAHFITKPIAAEILRLGPRRLVPYEFDRGFKDAHLIVFLNAGARKGVKKGMDFYVSEMDEWAEVTRVSRSTAEARFRRSVGQDGEESCWNSEGGSGDEVTCKKPKVGMRAETKMNEDL